MKKITVIVVILLFIGISIAPSISGKSQRTLPFFTRERTIFSSLEEPDIEVNDDGGDVDFTLIQKAINYANDGDVIWVYTGQYPENLDIIDKNITLLGKSYEKYNPDNIIEKPIINAENEDDTTAIYIKNAKCTISDFTIKNGKFMAIWIRNTGNNTITGNTISNNGGGIWLEHSSDNSITGNTISNNSRCIWLYNSSYNGITGNTISGSIWLDDSSYNSITGNTISGDIQLDDSSYNSITGNTISDNKRYAIILSNSIYINIINNILNSGGITIHGNSLVHYNTHTIENNMANDKPIRYYKNAENIDVPKNSAQIILANCINFTIQELDDISNVGIGIQILFSSNTTISKNTISNNGDDGIRLEHSSDNSITGNTISNNRDDGIQLYNSDDNNLSGNNVSFNDVGVYMYASYRNSISMNNITNNEIGLRLRCSFNNIIKENNFFTNFISNASFYHEKVIWYLINSMRHNRWRGNYWGKPSYLPQPVRGDIYIAHVGPMLYSVPLIIPWYEYDWFPAKEPYDIP